MPPTAGCTRPCWPSCARATTEVVSGTVVRVTGVLLAAGGGRRAGGPKVLRRAADGRPWLTRSVRVLVAGGCSDVVVVLGSAGAEARLLLAEHLCPADRVTAVDNPAWPLGMGSSLAVGLDTVRRGGTSAALVHLVDLPDVGSDVLVRLLRAAPPLPSCLARAGYLGRPGHPVLIGPDHLTPVLASLAGDAGARAYLRRAGAAVVECGDLATGQDVDTGAPVGG